MAKATVKWFNPEKGFGFVTPDGGSTDAFLHMSVVQRAGLHTLSDGMIIECSIGQGQKGPQVEEIYSAEAGSAPASSGGGQSRSSSSSSSSSSSRGGDSSEGTVKWFNPVKGFGFIQPDGGGKDVFVHISALERSGVRDLVEGQRIRLTTSMGQKGPQAETVEII